MQMSPRRRERERGARASGHRPRKERTELWGWSMEPGVMRLLKACKDGRVDAERDGSKIASGPELRTYVSEHFLRNILIDSQVD